MLTHPFPFLGYISLFNSSLPCRNLHQQKCQGFGPSDMGIREAWPLELWMTLCRAVNAQSILVGKGSWFRFGINTSLCRYCLVFYCSCCDTIKMTGQNLPGGSYYFGKCGVWYSYGNNKRVFTWTQQYP